MKMKKLKYTLCALAACGSIMLSSSCLRETHPQDGVLEGEISTSEASLVGLNNGIAKQLTTIGSDYSSYGYAGIMISRDVASGDSPIAYPTYEYFLWYGNDTYLGETGLTVIDWWALYSKVIYQANLVLKAAPEDDGKSSETVLACVGNALCYRAFAYLDMIRMYEYKKTGIARLDDLAQSKNIYGLTVPLVTEKTTEEASRDNPRQPFYVMYRFIMNDLNRAERCLKNTVRSKYNKADASVATALKAKLWLEIATRCSQSAEDLQAIVNHEDAAELAQYDKLGIKSSEDCYNNALACAKEVEALHAPLSKSEWFNTSSGFNTANHAWLLALSYSSDDLTGYNEAWQNFVSFISSETNFGIAGPTYNGARCIDANLYSTIEAGDFRRKSWIDPLDAGDVSKAADYATLLTADGFAGLAAYSNLKFRPGSGNLDEYLTGAAVDIPLMRVEDMYLIEAEALANTQGVASGAQALADFLNAYRYDDGSYVCPASSIDDFEAEILRQRRIEFWGEGSVFFDYKRLNRAVIKDYAGTNHQTSCQWNSLDGYVAPRMNICFPTSETLYNKAVINNPDPTGIHE